MGFDVVGGNQALQKTIRGVVYLGYVGWFLWAVSTQLGLGIKQVDALECPLSSANATLLTCVETLF